MATTLTTKGQVTIPKSVRRQLGLHAGDRVEFVVDDQGQARMIPLTHSVRDLKGMVPRPDHALTVEEMDQAIARGAAES